MRGRCRFEIRAAAVLLLLGWAQALAANQVVVKRNVNLRRDPSTSQQRIRLLKPPETLDLLEPGKTAGYFHVESTLGEKGWVWGANVAVVTGNASPSEGPANSISEEWARPEPAETTLINPDSGEKCGPSGDDDGNATNLRKNRTDLPATYHLVTFDSVAKLPYPDEAKRRADWTPAHLKEIARFEGAALTVTGYIVNRIKVQTGGRGESTNCHWTRSDEVDWHIPLVERPHDVEATAIVAETTPRVRIDHPKWTPGRLAPWVNTDKPVRVSGWLMFDPEHQNHLGKFRSTLWEVHPVTKIEVFKDGEWTDLAALP
jgi:hypothetical protein